MIKKLERLAERVLMGSVLPFVGAGFSYGARHPEEGWISEPSRIPGQLRELIDRSLHCVPSDGRPEACTLVDVRWGSDKSLSRLAELATIIFGARRVCEAIQIVGYAQLNPLPSHRFLVYLAREGLIREVITTNWDCCIERAFEQSLSPGSNPNEFLSVVRNVEEYREHAAKRTKPGHLLIYKVNGCAEAYRRAGAIGDDGLRNKAAERIILTERQLQNFRQEEWARDLFRDRARTRTFLFSGFGSEEAQIRHTALTLMDEFSRQYNDRQPDEVMDLPNAPFMHVHRRALSFYQLQIMVAFLDSHSHLLRFPPPDLPIRPIFRNVIHGANSHPLSASGLFEKLFLVVFARLVHDAAHDSGDFAVWLRSRTPEFRPWLQIVREFAGIWLRETRPTYKLLRSIARKSRAWRRLLCPVATGEPFPLPLWRLLWSMMFPGRAMPTDWYLPLREDSLLVLITLMFLRRLGFPAEADPPFTIWFDHSDVRYRLHLIEESALQERFDWQSSDPSRRFVRLISIPSRFVRSAEGRTVFYRDPRDCRDMRIIVVGRWSAVSAGDLVSAAVHPERLGDALHAAFAEIRARPAARLTPVKPQSEDAA